MKLHSNMSMNQLKKIIIFQLQTKLIVFKKKKDGAQCTNDGKGVKGRQETTAGTEKSAFSIIF